MTSTSPASAGSWWRTLEEHADDPAFRAFVARQYPSQTEALVDPVARRTFLKLMAASLALGGWTGCTRQPAEPILPYVRQPEEIVLGRPLFFATAVPLGGTVTGALVESHEGRPTKIEGNPEHPASLGASSAIMQAAILGLYDPDRSQTVTDRGEIRPWTACLGELRAALAAQAATGGAGLRILTESVSSPTLTAQIRDLLARYPAARWHQWDPASGEAARAGARLAFGEDVGVQYRFDRADVVLSLDADFLCAGPACLRYARDFSTRRHAAPSAPMSRFYAIESGSTATGARADHRLPLAPTALLAAARAIASAVGVRGVPGFAGGGAAPRSSTSSPLPAGPGVSEADAAWIAAAAADLAAHRGSSLVVAGDEAPPAVHLLAHAMNDALGNVDRTVAFTEPAVADPVDQIASLRDLVGAMQAGQVAMLLVIDGNPAYTAPADVPFGAALASVAFTAHLGLYEDETSAGCRWHIPQAHALESWSDGRAYDGTTSIVQPLIAPLYNGKSAHELLGALTDRPDRSGYDLVRDYWRGRAGQTGPAGPADFDETWRRWLHDGVIPGTACAPRRVAVLNDALGAQGVPSSDSTTASPPRSQAPGGRLEVCFRNDPSVLDGRFANNGWLQELPKPITRLTWDNAVLMSPRTATALGVAAAPSMQGGEHGQIVSDVVEVRAGGRRVRGAAFVVPGHADGCVTLHLGYGRTRAGRLGTGAGFDANALRTSDALSSVAGAEIVRVGEQSPLACTQYHHLMEGRDEIRVLTPADLAVAAAAPPQAAPGPRFLTMYPERPFEGHQWGMAIDLQSCIGCNACVVGCQAENNVPVVGKAQVLLGREMHWLRIDTYHRGPADRPETYFQPVPCMQCEDAPCEVVCPVGATVHSDEGLNDMVYNRCVGTRYCSNNCPYKVRRFNFLLYQDWTTPSLALGRNPDVSVRSRGVMEKCTYCVQRIAEAKIEAEKADRPLADGAIKTACQQACPAEAIVFGDLRDPNSRVVRLKTGVRHYALLEELNTRPRTTYLAAVRNRNPEAGD